MRVSVIKETKRDHVARELERQIGIGQLAPGRPLPTIRDLAATFAVSRQVIEAAFAQLAARHLIFSSPLVGVYVNPEAFSPSKREFCLLRLLVGGTDRLADYMERMLSISNPTVWQGCNLSTRSISDRHYSRGVLRYEIEKLRQAHVDCLFVYNPKLREDDISDLETLPFPVVFLGDTIPDACMGRVANQVVEETADRARAMVAAAAHYGYRDAVLIGAPLTTYYCQVMNTAGAAAAQAAGLKFRYQEQYEDCETVAELARMRRQCVTEMLAGGKPDLLLLDGHQQVGLFKEALAANGLEIGRDIGILADGEMCPGTLFLHSDYTPLSAKVLRLASALAAAPDQPLGRVVLPGLIKRTPMKIDGDRPARRL